MLEYVKTLLQKISFDLALFEKELKKSLSHYLQSQEIQSLKEWCEKTYKYSTPHAKIINACFEK